MSLAISVEKLSKAYQLGEFSTGTISQDIQRWWMLKRGKEDPFLKIGETNNRSTKGGSNIVWSLKDIDFKVEQGDSVGIIGRNGAGKSTLLKLLSQVTSPTSGSIKIKGRIASLLEVGTGFHPELSGRENIFLNGAILGMRKKEIQKQFDEIVDFSGVERYIDTPVKRYSSGMYVRLAFAVAAHLESEILIVDEVLAVGDAEFQKKCLGKMNDMSTSHGRTLLFVSHNMTAINSLCRTGIYLRNGELVKSGEANEVINYYLSTSTEVATRKRWDLENAPGDEVARLLEVKLTDTHGNDIDSIDFYQGAIMEYTYIILKSGYNPAPNVHIFNQKGDYVLISAPLKSQIHNEKGTYTVRMKIPSHYLNEGRYIVGVALSTIIPQTVHFYEQEALIVDVIEDMEQRDTDYRGNIPGIVRTILDWEVEAKN
jgi:lipopolysaccharide transport system ATP-binding protein